MTACLSIATFAAAGIRRLVFHVSDALYLGLSAAALVCFAIALSRGAARVARPRRRPPFDPRLQ